MGIGVNPLQNYAALVTLSAAANSFFAVDSNGSSSAKRAALFAEAAMAALQGGRDDAEGFAAEILFGFALDEGEGVVRGVAGGAEVGSGRSHWGRC